MFVRFQLFIVLHYVTVLSSGVFSKWMEKQL